MDSKKPKTINAELIYYMFDEIKAELREMKKDYVTKTESAALKHQIEELRQDFADYKKTAAEEVATIKKSKNLWSWLSPTLTAVLTAVVTYITLEFFRTH